MRIVVSFFIMALLPLFMSEEESPSVTIKVDKEYCNPRFNFCVQYPDSLLPIHVVSENNDGIILKSKDQSIVVSVSGFRSINGRDTWDLYDDFVASELADNTNSRILYEIIENSYYKTSFIVGNYRYFQTLYHRGNKYVIYQIIAPETMAFRIDKIREYVDLSLDKKLDLGG